MSDFGSHLNAGIAATAAIHLDQPAAARVTPNQRRGLRFEWLAQHCGIAFTTMRSDPSIHSSRSPSGLTLGLWVFVSLCWTTVGAAQTVFTPSPNYPPTNYPPVQPGVSTGPPVNIPQTNLTPIAPPASTYTPPANAYGSFDPYSSTPPVGATGVPPVTGANGPGVTTLGPPGGYPPAPTGNTSLFGLFSQPTAPPTSPAGYGSPTMAPVNNPPVYGSPPYGAPVAAAPGIYGPPTAYPNSVYPSSTPGSLFPQGYSGIYSGSLFTNPSTSYNSFRLFQGPRARYTYVTPGSKPNNLGINDFDFSLAFAFPNFLYMTQPFYVIPSFSLHLWSGPDSPVADRPSKAYSAFIDLGWESDPAKMVGTEFGLRLGIFTDFDTHNSKSWRARGRALVSFRMTPTSIFKGGVYYLNRNEVKLVPAFGFFCRPNPFTRIDLFFPKLRYARYCRTVGTSDLWWYLTGDYGGGNWTITRNEGYEDQVDINDLRAIFGLEWGPSSSLQAGRRTAFAEIAYVFSREVRYRYSPNDDFDPDDAFSFRIGIGY
jgi:hypothetical protein